MKKLIVQIGDKVKVDLNGKVQNLEIVDESPADTNSGKISVQSPLAQAILGQYYPTRIMFTTPTGNVIDCQLLGLAV